MNTVPMQRTRTAIIGAAALLIVEAAAAADLVQINPNESSEKYFLLPDSIVSVGDKVRAWFLTDYESPRTSRSGLQYRSAKSMWVFDCTARASGLQQLVLYQGAGGSETVVQSGEQVGSLSGVVPGSVGESMLVAACAGAPPPQQQQPKLHRYSF